jgi:hypothetical protein
LQEKLEPLLENEWKLISGKEVVSIVPEVLSILKLVSEGKL